MKKHILNATLMVSLFTLMILPLFGFIFLDFSQTIYVGKDVLGTKTVVGPKTKIASFKIDLALSQDLDQVFYDVIPKEYINSGYSYKINLVGPNSAAITPYLVKDGTGMNLRLQVDEAASVLLDKNIEVIVMVYR